MAKQKFYTVWEGRKKGIFKDWETCKLQVEGYEGAKYKSFSTEKEAKDAFKRSYWSVIGKNALGLPDLNKYEKELIGKPVYPSISVDAACSGNPGLMEYRGVDTKSGEELFHQGPFEQGTNNVGEFLALVHGLALLKKANSSVPVYTDSVNAITWVKAKKCKTKLVENDKNKSIFELIDRAENWLADNEYPNQIFKWETKVWGEIPADFGRK
jgi:ribonuclease HI